jgi:hypothetical protein
MERRAPATSSIVLDDTYHQNLVTPKQTKNKNIPRSNDDAEDDCPIFFSGEEEVWNITRTIEMIYSHPHIYSTNNNDIRNSTHIPLCQYDAFNNHPSEQNLYVVDQKDHGYHAIRSSTANENKRHANFPQDQDLMLQEQPPPRQQSSNKMAVAIKKVSKYDMKWMCQFEELKAFFAKNGHSDVPNRYKENPSLGYWVGTQRESYKVYLELKQLKKDKNATLRHQIVHSTNRKRKRSRCPLTQTRIDKLSSLNFKFSRRRGN